MNATMPSNRPAQRMMSALVRAPGVRQSGFNALTGLVVLALGLVACAGSSTPPAAGLQVRGVTPGEVRIQLVAFNDLYEIMPTGDGLTGGPARTATLLARLEKDNPLTVSVLAGDLLSPSALGTARVDGQRLQGRQMVAVMNAMGLDFATFGNHEFDLGEEAFRERLTESRFQWISSNVQATSTQPLPNLVSHVVLRFPVGPTDTLRLALFGITMDRDASDYARIAEPLGAAAAQAGVLRDSADIIVAITHLPIAQDIALAESTPEIDLIVGGHDHENLLLMRGAGLTPIAKADANLRSVFVHELVWSTASRSLRIESRLVPITDAIETDPATQAIAREWERRGFDGFREAGFEPQRVVAKSTVYLDGIEATVLRDTTTLSRVIAEGMLAEATGADAAIYNAGSIRVDDVLPPGSLTQYDVIRILPFGGPVVEVEMTGALLRRVLTQGEQNRGTGGFIQKANIEGGGGEWTVGGRPLTDVETYRLAVSDFLISGREQGMDWLTREHAELTVLRELRDVRFTLIDQLARTFPPGN